MAVYNYFWSYSIVSDIGAQKTIDVYDCQTKKIETVFYA